MAEGLSTVVRVPRKAFGQAPRREPSPVSGARPLRGSTRGPLAFGLVVAMSSGLAWASLAGASSSSRDAAHQWRALTVQPLSAGGRTGLRMAPGNAAEIVESVRSRKQPFTLPHQQSRIESAPNATGPQRIRGQAGDGLYWSLRSAGASPDIAAQYLSALARQIDVGIDVARGDRFDLVVSGGTSPRLLYAGLQRGLGDDLQLVRWGDGAQSEWIDAARDDTPEPVETGLLMPASGRITSYFGTRIHPILRFARFHAGIDIGAGWGSPIVAAADGQVVGAGWAGGYGRQVRIAHGNGLVSTYSHMSEFAASPGMIVRRGQVIGYVGSSGLSTGPHLHFEVKQGGSPINPLGVRMISVAAIDPQRMQAVRARMASLLRIGSKSA